MPSFVGGVILLTVFVAWLAIMRRVDRTLKVLEEEQAPADPVKPTEVLKTINSPIQTEIWELDAVDTMIPWPELDAEVLSELPVNEAVGSELCEYGNPKGKQKTISLRQRELIHKRNALRQAQFRKRLEFIRDQPQFMFGGMAQPVSIQVVPPEPTQQPPQFQTPTWDSSQMKGSPGTRAWSSPAISPTACKRQSSNPVKLESRLNRAGFRHQPSNLSKFGSI